MPLDPWNLTAARTRLLAEHCRVAGGARSWRSSALPCSAHKNRTPSIARTREVSRFMDDLGEHRREPRGRAHG
jgi:hypothetical protein